MDYSIYRKNIARINVLIADRDKLANVRRTAVALCDWQFSINFGDETVRGYAGIKDVVIADLEEGVAVIDSELSSYGFTFDGQQNLPLDAAPNFRSYERVPFPHLEGKGPGEYYDNKPPSA